MNQRIQTLIEQVGTDVSGKWISVDNAEKLTELMVQECANYITEYYPHSRYEAFYMKKHFGVEE